MAGNPLTQYGYPSAGQLRGQAASLANAAVPTIGSINRQYGRQQENVTGFTNALVSALRGDQGAVGQGYNQALAQQQAIDSAAHAALSALGPQFAGAAVAQGGVGDSAASRLIANSAAAKNYAGQLPGVGASQGALAHTTLTEGQNQAIQTRNDAYRSALSQAFQQVQSNALARAQAAADIGLNQSKLSLEQKQLAQQNSQFNATLNQRAAQFTASQQQQYNEFTQNLHQQEAAAQAAAGKSPWTSSQLTHFRDDAASTIEQAIKGVPNPNYGKMVNQKQPDGTYKRVRANPNASRWIVLPNQGYGNNGATVIDVYQHMRNHGIPEFVAVDEIRRQYDAAVFQRFVSQQLPGLYQAIYGTPARRGDRTQNRGRGRQE